MPIQFDFLFSILYSHTFCPSPCSKKCYGFSKGRLCQIHLWQIDTRKTVFTLWQYHPEYLICNLELVSRSFCHRSQPDTGRGTRSQKEQVCHCWGMGHTGKGQTCLRILSGLSPGCGAWSQHMAHSSPNPRWVIPGRQPFSKQLPRHSRVLLGVAARFLRH